MSWDICGEVLTSELRIKRDVWGLLSDGGSIPTMQVANK